MVQEDCAIEPLFNWLASFLGGFIIGAEQDKTH